MMEANTLYYYYSTTSQVLAAIAALLAIFSQFKLTEIKNFLTGDGIAVYERMKNNEIGYILNENHKKDSDRLRDSIARASIKGIEEVIIQLAELEKAAGKTIETNPRGLQYLKSRFSKRIDQIKKIKRLTRSSLTVSLLTIFIALTSLIFVEKMKPYNYFCWILMMLTLISTSLSLIYTIRGVHEGLKDLEEI